MAIVLFEEETQRRKFFPLTCTRPFAAIHYGICSVKEWWQKLSGQAVLVQTAAYLQEDILHADEPHFFINAHFLPDKDLWEEIQNLRLEESLLAQDGYLIAKKSLFPEVHPVTGFSTKSKCTVTFVEYPYQLLQNHTAVIEAQFLLFTKARNASFVSPSNHLLFPEKIFVEENVEMEYATLNAKDGYMYIGANSTVMEGALIRGAFALGKNSTVKMGAKIYGAVSTADNCIIGGEVKNSIFQRCSNKGHDGYLGDSLVGSWCNFGGGTSNSNVKNTAGAVVVYDYSIGDFRAFGKKFGLIMGDYSRVAINSSVNTGSSIGVCCNVFGEGLLPKLISSFSWGTDPVKQNYQLEKALKHIQDWKSFKGEKLLEKEISVLRHIFEHSEM